MAAYYVFLCTSDTEKECLKEKIFGLSEKYLYVVRKIRKGDRLFLYNMDTDSLYGVFEAASDGSENISPQAWGGRYPAQVKVNIDYEQLKEITNASSEFPFLRRKTVELTKEQAEMLLKRFEGAPVLGEPIYVEHTIPDAERLFAAFLDEQEIPYVRISQETEDFSKTLRKMKAKRPDFLIFVKGRQIFVEVKTNLVQDEVPHILIDVDEVNKLNQFQLQTGIETIIVFPLDKHGTAWKPLRPSWIVANGMKRKIQDKEFFIINIRKTEKIKLPFTLEA